MRFAIRNDECRAVVNQDGWMDGVWRHCTGGPGELPWIDAAPEVPIIDMSIYNCRASTTVNSKRLTETDLGDE